MPANYLMPQPWTTWISHLRRWGRRCFRLGGVDARPTGATGVAQLGHREYVGGRWEEIGKLQFEYLKAQGLRPDHVLLDVACGSLRAGVHLIPYLNPEHYWGLEKEPDLIAAGVEQELHAETRLQKRPHFLINAKFDVTGMNVSADYMWIHSLFTHLPLNSIEGCLAQLKAAAGPKTICYATFFETRHQRENFHQSHDHETFFYTVEEMTSCAYAAGWNLAYVGDWGHPRGQRMIRLTRESSQS